MNSCLAIKSSTWIQWITIGSYYRAVSRLTFLCDVNIICGWGSFLLHFLDLKLARTYYELKCFYTDIDNEFFQCIVHCTLHTVPDKEHSLVNGQPSSMKWIKGTNKNWIYCASVAIHYNYICIYRDRELFYVFFFHRSHWYYRWCFSFNYFFWNGV